MIRVSDINEYDKIENKSKYYKIIVLSFNDDFKNYISEVFPFKRTIQLEFEKNSTFETIKTWNEYIICFLQVLKEANFLIIDADDYSYGFKLLHSCALNCQSINTVFIYKHEDDENDYRLISDINSPLYNKEDIKIK